MAFRLPPLRALAVLLLVAVVGACTQQRDTADAGLPAPPPTERKGTIGETESLFDVEVVLLSLEAFDQTPEAFPRLRLTMRSENTTARMLRNPDVSLLCDEAEEPGEWYLGSTWEANSLLPPGGVAEGELYVGFPAKPGADRYAVPTCTNARIHVTATNISDRTRVIVVYQVQPSIIDAAIDAPLGRRLPLPPQGF